MAGAMDAPIAKMYQAARLYIPDAASNLSDVALYIQSPVATLDVAAAAAGDPQVMRDMLFVLGQVSAAASKGVKSLNDAAAALEKTADDFVSTDARAADDSRRLTRALHSNRTLGLNPGDKTKLEQKSPDQAPEFGTTGDRSAPGANETVYDDIDYHGRLHTIRIHHDSNQGAAQTPDEDRQGRDDSETDSLDGITGGL